MYNQVVAFWNSAGRHIVVEILDGGSGGFDGKGRKGGDGIVWVWIIFLVRAKHFSCLTSPLT